MTIPYVGLAAADQDVNTAIMPKPLLENEFGIGSEMPFSIPYDGPRAGQDTLYEQLRPLGEDDGPSVSQLVMMRRTDGQARALYRLIVQPIRSALKTSRVISSEMADLQSRGISTTPTAPGKAPAPAAPPTPAPAPAPDANQQPGQGKGQLALSDQQDTNVTAHKGEGDDEAMFIQQMLMMPPSGGGMVVPLRKFMAQLLMAVFDGFAPFELVYWVPTTGPLKGKITLKKAAYRPAATCTFLTDKEGNFQGIRQRTFYHGETIDVKIDGNNVLYYAAQEEERQFYGISYFQTAFYHFDKKAKLYYIAHLAAQRAATGTRVGTIPQNAGRNDKIHFQTALANMGVAQYITLPGPDWKVDVLKDAGIFDFMTYINHHNSMMSKSILAEFFDQHQGSGKSESTISSTSRGGQSQGMSDIFIAMLKAIMEDIAEIINNVLIPRFIDWNFGSGNYPKFLWGAFTDDQTAAIRDTFDKLATAGQQSNVTPEFMRALEENQAQEMGLDIDYTEVAKREAEEDAQQQAMQAAIAAGGSAPGVMGGQAKPGQPGTGAPPANPAAAIAAAKGSLSKAPSVGLTEDGEDMLLALAAQLLDAARVGV